MRRNLQGKHESGLKYTCPNCTMYTKVNYSLQLLIDIRSTQIVCIHIIKNMSSTLGR